jgi:hypothetical protein
MANIKIKYLSSLHDGRFNLIINGISYLLKPAEFESLRWEIEKILKELKENDRKSS